MPTVKPCDFVCYMQVVKDDFFLIETCRRIYDEGVRNFYFHVPVNLWTGKPIPVMWLLEISVVVDQMRKWPDIAILTDKCELESFPTEKRVDFETRVRRQALENLRKMSFRHILVVDGDELWKPGALRPVIEKVEAGATCVSLRMTSVIGLPGYPISGGTDDAIVYFGGEHKISVCRYPEGGRFVKTLGEWIFHFTGTRKTEAEIYQKMRGSGHYDDERYAFEEWLINMKKLRPGFKRAHMFKHRDVWPAVREWTRQEIALIPACYHPYLAIPK